MIADSNIPNIKEKAHRNTQGYGEGCQRQRERTKQETADRYQAALGKQVLMAE